ncbi:MAG TPA: response regulator [Terriglobales bacterium]|jgi:CheY-like chemotaxis protein|nr:response regulator [Terriglobales bacterium]
MKRILVADDDAVLREMIHDTLGVLGYEVTLVENGDEVLQQLAGSPPDLVLLDIQIPLLDGISVVKKIRGNPELAGLKVVALSAFAMRGDDQKALDAGFDAYLTKPISIADLRKKVQQMLNIL